MNKKVFGIIGVVLIVLLLLISSSVTKDKGTSSSDDIQTIISNGKHKKIELLLPKSMMAVTIKFLGENNVRSTP